MASPPVKPDPDRPSTAGHPTPLLHRIRTLVERAVDRLLGRRRVHVIHMGKTGGTALKHALRPHRRSAGFRIILHDHFVSLRDIPTGELFVFLVRDPVSRFASAFCSRQRQGRPRFDAPWTEEERAAFGRYRSPNQLALDLGADEAARRAEAEAAMRAIKHVRTSYWDWFENEAAFRARLADLFFVGFQETLPEDFSELRSILGLPDTVTLPNDDIAAHRTPPDVDLHLDEDAKAALRRWYEQDLAFVDLCREVAPRRPVARA
jgi:hypothetical protein